MFALQHHIAFAQKNGRARLWRVNQNNGRCARRESGGLCFLIPLQPFRRDEIRDRGVLNPNVVSTETRLLCDGKGKLQLRFLLGPEGRGEVGAAARAQRSRSLCRVIRTRGSMPGPGTGREDGCGRSTGTGARETSRSVTTIL